VHGLNDRTVPPAWTLAWMGQLAGLPPPPAKEGTWLVEDGAWKAGEAGPEQRLVLQLLPLQGHDAWSASYGDPRLWRWVAEQRRGK
jgi:hypothetical protein